MTLATPNAIVPDGPAAIPDGPGSRVAAGALAYAPGRSALRPVAVRRWLPARGSVSTSVGWPSVDPPQGEEVNYHVYGGSVPPIDYATPIGTTAATTWTTGSLSVGANSFGVRAFAPWLGEQYGGMGFGGAGFGTAEELNLDCAVTIVLDASGKDITNVPAPPLGLRAFATAGGGIRVEWYYPATTGPTTPTGFHVYSGTGGSPSYSAPAATVGWTAGVLSRYRADLSGLTGGTAYTIGVRAYNSFGEESNTTAVTVTADATGPAAVSSLTAIAIA